MAKVLCCPNSEVTSNLLRSLTVPLLRGPHDRARSVPSELFVIAHLPFHVLIDGCIYLINNGFLYQHINTASRPLEYPCVVWQNP